MRLRGAVPGRAKPGRSGYGAPSAASRARREGPDHERRGRRSAPSFGYSSFMTRAWHKRATEGIAGLPAVTTLPWVVPPNQGAMGMVDVAMISGAMTALKAVGESAKAMIAIHDASVLHTKVIELNTQIMTAQTSALAALSDQFALLERVGELEKQVAGFEAWETEKQRYELKDLDSGPLAYVLKPDAGGGEAAHWLCATCYQQRKKSILQPFVALAPLPGRHGRIWSCPTCSTKIDVHWTKKPGVIGS
jgi:hypothetical protein